MHGKTDAIRKMFEEVSLGAPENAVGFVMWRIVVQCQREVDRTLESCNLTNLQSSPSHRLHGSAAKTSRRPRLSLRAGQASIRCRFRRRSKPPKSKRWYPGSEARQICGQSGSKMTIIGLNTLRAAVPRVIAVQHRIFAKEGRPSCFACAASAACGRG